MQTIRAFLVASLMLSASAAQAMSPPPPLPVDFLTDFYIAMDGDNWHRNDGWLDPDVPICDWHGISCTSVNAMFTWINHIDLPNNNLRGELDLSLIVEMYRYALSPTPRFRLDLSGNFISGELAVLPIGPRFVDLSNNLLSGPLPSMPEPFESDDGSPIEPRYLDQLRHLDLSGNQFSGTIPDDWDVLELDILDLSDNQLEGSVETAFRALRPQGATLRLADNAFSDSIDPDWLVDRTLNVINLCWTDIQAEGELLAEWLQDVHEGGPPELCKDRERLALSPEISGSWFDPARNGEGFSLMLLDDGTPVVYWFSHISNNRQHWLFNVGRAQDEGTRFRPILRTQGLFGLGLDDDELAMRRGGELRLDRISDDLLHAEFRISYQLHDTTQPGAIIITPPPLPDTLFRSDQVRLSQLAGTTCDNGVPQQWISGLWFDPERNGEGFVVEVNTDGRGVVYWFTYPAVDEPDTLGQRQTWMMGVGQFEGNQLIVDTLLRPRDTGFAMPENAEHIVAEPWGTLILDFHDDEQGQAEFAGLDDDFGSGSFPIQRLARPLLANCED